MAAILTNSGRVALAISIMAQPIHLAWGTGLPDWDTTPSLVTKDISDLVAEVGRRACTSADYCYPDAAGTIVVPVGEDTDSDGNVTQIVDRFTVSATPTNVLYLRFNFDAFDSPSATIRETAIFVGTKTRAGLPAGQLYFAPSDVTDRGTLLMVDRFAKFDRSSAVRQAFEFVVTL